MNKMTQSFRYWWVGLATAFLGLTIVGGIFVLRSISTNKEIVEHEVFSESFGIRATRSLVGPLRYNYAFQTKTESHGKWRTIYSHTQDDPSPVSDNQIGILDESSGYFWIGSVFVFTRDGGRTWTFFNLQTSSSFGRANREAVWIGNAFLKPDGTGEIVLVKYRGASPPIFKTSDFGNTWVEVF